MSANKIAKRYAAALMDVCGLEQAETVLSQLQAVELCQIKLYKCFLQTLNQKKSKSYK
jgi:hypothetical protein